MTTERDDPSRDHDQDPGEPVDPDVALMVTYLAGELPPDEAEKVEDRFIEDELFARKVQPLITIWTAPIDFRAAYEAYAAKERAEAGSRPPWQSREAASSYTYTPRRRPTAVTPAALPVPPAPIAPLVSPVDSADDEHFYERVLARDKRADRWSTFTERVNVMYKVAVIALTVVTVPSMLTYGYLRFEARNAFVPVGADGKPVPGMARSQGVEVPDASHTVLLKGGSRVVVRGGTKFNAVYPILAGIPPRLTVEGEAALDVSAEEKMVEVKAAGVGQVLLRPGTYAVRCEPGCAAMLVTVGIGTAMMRGDSVKTVVTIHDGEHAMIRRGGAAEKVEGSAAFGYPSPEVKAKSPAPIAVPGGGDGKAPVETGDRTVHVGLSSFVRLRAGSRFALARGVPDFAQDIGLNGEATIEVGLLERKVIVSTPAGIVELSHGLYALRARGDPDAETLVTVGQGTATLKGGAGAADLVLSAGEHGRLAYPAPPRRTSGGDGYPALDRTGRTKP